MKCVGLTLDNMQIVIFFENNRVYQFRWAVDSLHTVGQPCKSIELYLTSCVRSYKPIGVMSENDIRELMEYFREYMPGFTGDAVLPFKMQMSPECRANTVKHILESPLEYMHWGLQVFDQYGSSSSED